MAALQSNPEILTSALLRLARSRTDGKAWLIAIQADALTASLGGDVFGSSVSKTDSSTAWMRELPANIIAQIAEVCIQRLEAAEAAEEEGITGALPPGNIRQADFSKHPAILG